MPSVGTKKDQEKGNQINPSETSRATPVITYSTSLPTFPPHLWLKSVLAERASGNSIPCNTCGRADEPWHNRHSGEMTVRFSSHGGCPLPCRCLAALLDASRSYAQHPQPPDSDNEKCLQTLPDGYWGAERQNYPLLTTSDTKEVDSFVSRTLNNSIRTHISF